MARYVIYDNSSNVITPSGAEFTAEEWLNRYPWGRKVKMIVGGGVINGNVALLFDDFVAEMRRQGCDFAGCSTDQDYLDAIEKFEDAAATAPAPITDQTRMADALEDMVVLQMPDVTEPMAAFAQVPGSKSPMYDTLERRWKQRRISEAMLRLYVRKGCITQAELDSIVGTP